MQNTNAIIMVRPACFGWNAETAESNHFQQISIMESSEIHLNALLEFDLACDFLRQKGLKVTVLQDCLENKTPDSIFPNNWFSTHADGTLIGYPMLAHNRRRERIANFDLVLLKEGFRVSEWLDLTAAENQGKFLEGTGSLILDRVNKRVYAARSPRTHEQLVENWAKKMGFVPIVFSAFDSRGEKPTAIYHTNVLLSIGEHLAIFCGEAVPENERNQVVQSLIESGKSVLFISLEQMDQFAGNALELKNHQGKKIWVMSTTAQKSLRGDQLEKIQEQGEIVALHIPTIERIGGGSARCMIAENFLPEV